MSELSVFSLLLFTVQQNFISYTLLFLSLQLCHYHFTSLMCFSPSPLISSTSYCCPQALRVFSSFNPCSQPLSLSLSLLLSLFDIFIHPSIRILFSPPPLLSLPPHFCLLFTFFFSVSPPCACWTTRNVTLTKN